MQDCLDILISLPIIQNAKTLRNNSTLAEVLLWKKLRAKQLGVQFYRQKPLEKRFIADFYCAKFKLIVELDGLYHNYIFENDELRDEYLKECGYTTIHFSNKEIIDDITYVVSEIKRFLRY